MTTTVYFIRHAESNQDNHDDFTRELSPKGLSDRQQIIDYFKGIEIPAMYSSLYKRSIDTIQPLANQKMLNIITVEDFRERKITDQWIENFDEFSKKQWKDFNYKFPDGDSLNEVALRNVTALENLLEIHVGQSIVVGSHGTALSMIINHYTGKFMFEDFNKIKGVMPWLVQFNFNGSKLIGIEHEHFRG